MSRLRFLSVVLLALGLLLGHGPRSGYAQQTDTTEETTIPGLKMPPEQESDVPYVPTPKPVVDRMLELADVDETDVIYDLGSGDGRIVIRAARTHGARGVGIEIDPDLVKKARKNAKEAGVADLVEFRQGDLFEADISEATVVTLYLLPSVNQKLRPILFEQLSPGTPVVSHDFDMGRWAPDRTVDLEGDTVYRWTIPEEIPEDLDE
ncbi:SAM-dependent methyltransferase [Salinibacter ruber]|jgi:SAM-dependent methyltransferase|uniref:SAM-dependent methyltransferase n=1 Tax=Salinibacter ruber TaxID=146919 RepID=A0AAW5P3L0_9BACT|nr:methyltransferase domain-containing protein [Salinibacter ruber]MCS3862691.1 SAM-dependent methyltransferase [Salinibacter ruber]MCS4156084.1 SAM-dependent methyltransferase [Salinibacter ruber]MCS4223534.1 SAM-dependent methyltransferase [Salinibacter ruber]